MITAKITITRDVTCIREACEVFGSCCVAQETDRAITCEQEIPITIEAVWSHEDPDAGLSGGWDIESAEDPDGEQVELTEEQIVDAYRALDRECERRARP